MITRLALLNKIGILGKAGGIHHHRNVIFLRDGIHAAQIGNGYRLATSGITGNSANNIWHIFSARFFNARFQFFQIKIAFEIVFDAGIKGFFGISVFYRTAIDLRMALRGIKEIIGKSDHFAAVETFFLLAFFNEYRNVDLLGAAPLVGRDGVLVAEDFFDGFGKRVITAAAAVGFVTAQHRCLHVLRDRAGATVGQKVNKDVFAVEQKRVHAGLENGFFAMLTRGAFDRFDDADAEGFGDVGEVFHDRFLIVC